MANRITETIMIAIGLLKLILLGGFLISLSTASASFAAEDPLVCHGENLIEKLRVEQPEKYATLIIEANAVMNASSIFWKIEKQGIAPSYLLGTMHVSDPRVTKLSTAANKALNNAKTVIVENIESLDPKKAAAAMVRLRHLTFLKQGDSLGSRLSDDLKTKLKTAITARGIPFQIADKMQPWLVTTLVALPICELLAKRSGKKILDHLVAKHALDEGKNLIGLETTEEQFTAIANLPDSFHFSALKETLIKGSKQTEDVIATMKEIYISGNIGMLMPLLKAISPEAYSGEGTAAFQEALINKRNHVMAERAKSALEKGNAFMAVGALHLPGETGLINLLRKQGFKITAVTVAN